MITARHRVLQVTHFPWLNAIFYAAIALALFAIASSGMVAPAFFYIMGALSLAPVLDLRVTSLQFDRQTRELVIKRRRWWRVRSETETHPTAGLTAIVRRHKAWTPGPPIKRNTQFHDRLTLAVFDDGREVLLFSHPWLPTRLTIDRKIARELGVDFRLEDYGVEEGML